MNHIIPVIVLCLVFLVSCNNEKDLSDSNNTAEPELSNEPRNPLDPIESLQVVYIGVSSCTFCTSEEGLDNLKIIFERIDEIADHLDFESWYTGIAADEDPLTGFEHLLEVGTFHEINTGAYYFNLGHIKYIWGEGDFAGPASVPQLLINRSTYQIEPAGMSIGNVNRDEKVLKRYRGSSEIGELAEHIQNMTMDELSEYFGL
ncbi:MAG: hypothetical protein LAT51_13055 [Flavobacteriaceae bacterium]|nr:hypothetical protein [Flavobacteriaceae bacterium]